MTDAIAIEGVQKHYGAIHALAGIDLAIAPGEFFGLLGPNGAGKSTLINIIAGLARADGGRVSVMGHDVVGEYRRARRCLGVVPQELVFDPFFSVREVLRLQSGYFGLGRENDAWIEELMVALRLTDRADANMRALSGGMKRRVLIAQALVHRPDVVILDEPTAGVDVEVRMLLWQFIRRLHGEGRTIVLTTHYLEEAETLCGRIAILNHGRIVALDTKQGLLNGAIGPADAVRLVTARPVSTLPPEVAAVVRRTDGNTLEIELRRGGDTLVTLLNRLHQAGVEVTDVHTERPRLEQVFMNHTYRRAP